MPFLQKPKTSLLLWTNRKTKIAFFVLSGIVIGSNFAFRLFEFHLLPLFLFLIVLFFLFAWKKGKIAIVSFVFTLCFSFCLQSIPIFDEEEITAQFSGVVVETRNNYFLNSKVHVRPRKVSLYRRFSCFSSRDSAKSPSFSLPFR